jgi:hypothetical protein
MRINGAGRYLEQRSLISGTPVIVTFAHGGASFVGIAPESGASVAVEFSISAEEDIAAGTAEWHAWQHGAVTAKILQDLPQSPMAARFTASDGNAKVEVRQ